MTRASPSERSRSTEEKILEATRALLATRGFEAEVTEVATLAQVGMKSIYSRWKSREGLIGCVLEEMLSDARRRALQIQSEIHDPCDAIRALNRLGFDHVERYGLLASLASSCDVPPAFEHHVRERAEELWRMMGSLIKRGVAQGLFRPDVDTPLVVLSWTAIVSPRGMRLLEYRGYTTDEMADHVSDFVISSASK